MQSTLDLIDPLGKFLRHDGRNPPPRKEGKEYSDEVLVYYPQILNGPRARFSIAWYDYSPSCDCWRDLEYCHRARVALYWWYLPSILEQNDEYETSFLELQKRMGDDVCYKMQKKNCDDC